MEQDLGSIAFFNNSRLIGVNSSCSIEKLKFEKYNFSVLPFAKQL